MNETDPAFGAPGTRCPAFETRQKRLQQMLDELVRGDVYMKMPWRPSRIRASVTRAFVPSGRGAG
ncbi:hypothetical protein [Geochorda subterranea]|uniref:Uncharacterized protein n=1 Tax=Geochorda subterranea TaxID=3109564 RepID=A0ABZ1BMK1_9FIRM|nr:hypothetical protein [Limnochorda sp. LNt]WRP13800.1 hypothetical protein VLY81_10185 [Limnochorda sp. LNt]